ncbi:MAG: hypothetical protein HY815_26765 [Candidatus Riflebacteria bacterium]|nr:hypothetical protein [Candidatus Riflebacteria bacterium]
MRRWLPRIAALVVGLTVWWVLAQRLFGDPWPVNNVEPITTGTLPTYMLEPVLDAANPVRLRIHELDIVTRQTVHASFGEHRPAGAGQTPLYLHNGVDSSASPCSALSGEGLLSPLMMLTTPLLALSVLLAVWGALSDEFRRRAAPTLALLAYPAFSWLSQGGRIAIDRSATRACYANQKTVAGALEMYHLDKGTKLDPRRDLESFWEPLKSGGYLQHTPRDPGFRPSSRKHYRLCPGGQRHHLHGPRRDPGPTPPRPVSPCRRLEKVSPAPPRNGRGRPSPPVPELDARRRLADPHGIRYATPAQEHPRRPHGPPRLEACSTDGPPPLLGVEGTTHAGSVT